MKKLLILFTILFSLNSIAQVSFTTNYFTNAKHNDTITIESYTNIWIGTDKVTIQSVELGTYSIELFNPRSFISGEGNTVMVYFAKHPNIYEIYVDAEQKNLMIKFKDETILLFFTY